MILVLVGAGSELLCLLLGLVLLVGGFGGKLFGALFGFGFEFVLALLGAGLDGLGLKVRGYRGDVRAVDVDELGDVVVGVLDFGDVRGAPVGLVRFPEL